MTDLTTLAAQRCAELANDECWVTDDFMPGQFGGETCRALAERILADHHLATAAIAKHPDLKDDLAGMILDADVLIAREAIRNIYSATHDTNGNLLPGDGPPRVNRILNFGETDYWEVKAICEAIRLYRQREGGNHAG